MSYNLIVNNSNVVNTLNNQYRYNFTKGNFTVPEGAEMMITNFQVPYSWYNISVKYNNNSFTLFWPKGASGAYTTFTVTIQDGFYTTTTLNAYLQNFCITNGLYLINSTGTYIYYIQLVYNSTYYANQIITTLVPTSLPGGYTQPANWIGYPTTSYTPYIQILNTNTFGTFLGFTSGYYPVANYASNYSINSNITPVGSNVNSLVIRCSLVNNTVTNPSDILDAFPINGTYASNLNFINQIAKWIKISPGSYSSFTITIVDQNLNDIVMLDNNLLFNIIIRIKKK